MSDRVREELRLRSDRAPSRLARSHRTTSGLSDPKGQPLLPNGMSLRRERPNRRRTQSRDAKSRHRSDLSRSIKSLRRSDTSSPNLIALAFICLALGANTFTSVSHAQNISGQEFTPDTRRAVSAQGSFGPNRTRPNSTAPVRTEDLRERAVNSDEARRTVRPPARELYSYGNSTEALIGAGTPLMRVLHTSQLSITSTAGTDEQYVDRNNDMVADERTTFDSLGGSFDIAVGRSGARYEVYSAVDNKGTATTTDDELIGVLVTALDTNGDFVRDNGFSQTYNLRRDFNLPSAASVVTGVSKQGREFVIVSSSGYYNYNDRHDPNNEPTAGAVRALRGHTAGGGGTTPARAAVPDGRGPI